MERTLFNVRSEVGFLGRIESKAGGQRFPRQLSFCRGRGFEAIKKLNPSIVSKLLDKRTKSLLSSRRYGSSSHTNRLLIKSSYPVARTPREGIDLVATKKLPGSDLSKINGNRGTDSSWASTREGFVLDAYEDEYGGIIINPDKLPQNANIFSSVLRASLSHWKLKGRQGVWLKLPVDLSELVPVAIKEGFSYHHAEPSYVMLTYWIPEAPCMLPANASHQVGVGGFVINEKDEVLVVQEKHCGSFGGVWKLPTGFIHESEEIFAGAVREVKEETGIDTEFVEVIAFRHAHHVAFEKSDLFFICMLRPLSDHIVIDDLEIQAAKWMSLDEFIKHPFVQGDCMIKKIIDICIARLGKRYCGLAAQQVVSKFDGRYSSLYYNVAEPQDFNCQGLDST